VFDLTPTFLNFADVPYPDKFGDVALPEMQGLSLKPLLAGADDFAFQTRPLGWEAYGIDALRVGDWKSLRLPPPFGNGKWQLYNLKSDPGETTDLAVEHAERLEQMGVQWDAYAEKNGVVHPDSAVFYSKDPGTGKF